MAIYTLRINFILVIYLVKLYIRIGQTYKNKERINKISVFK